MGSHNQYCRENTSLQWREIELVTDRIPVPVKLTVACLGPGQVMVTLMIPKGNMITILLQQEGGNLKQIKFHMTEKEAPLEIIEMEHEMTQFLKKGLTKINREGDSLRLTVTGDDSHVFTVDEKCKTKVPGAK